MNNSGPVLNESIRPVSSAQDPQEESKGPAQQSPGQGQMDQSFRDSVKPSPNVNQTDLNQSYTANLERRVSDMAITNALYKKELHEAQK